MRAIALIRPCVPPPSLSLSISARQRQWSLLDRLTFLWCIACFGIHLFLEGYFALNNRTIATDMSFLGQVCTSGALACPMRVRVSVCTSLSLSLLVSVCK
jgi:hypothetical protein